MVIQLKQRVQRERVVGVKAVAIGQPCAPTFETPMVEIESARCQPLVVMCQTVLVGDLAQR
jgi:hypothetical protein